MAEKIRPPHLTPASASSQQPLLPPPAQMVESGQHGMSKTQHSPSLHSHSHSPSHPDVALHARTSSSSVTGTRHYPFSQTIKLTHNSSPESIHQSYISTEIFF